jgi:hypothetical protein
MRQGSPLNGLARGRCYCELSCSADLAKQRCTPRAESSVHVAKADSGRFCQTPRAKLLDSRALNTYSDARECPFVLAW